MKQFTVITKDGSKWLRPVNPFDPRDIMWQEFNLKEPDLLYLGNRPEGTTLDEGEVREVRQGLCEYTMKWITEYDNDLPTYNRYRTVYTDDESHDRHIRPFNTQNVRPLVNQLVGEEISFSRFVELLNGIANTH